MNSMNKGLLILVGVLALISVADAVGQWYHRYGAGNKEDWYYFPAACPALANANPAFPDCPTGPANGHGSPNGAKHQTRFVSYVGCPHAHFGYTRRGRWKRFHGVRFNELLKKGSRLRRRDVGFMNEATLEGMFCAGDSATDLVADVVYPTHPAVEKEKTEGQNVKGTVFDTKDQVKGKEGPDPAVADDKDVGKQTLEEFTIPTGACTEKELNDLFKPLFEVTKFNAANKKVTLKASPELFKALVTDPAGAAPAAAGPAPARPGNF